MARSDGQVCIVLAAGFSNVERELEQASHGPLRELAGLPKALLPVAGKPILDHWWTYLSQHRAVSEIFIVCNAIRYKQFERWATAKGIDVSRVVNTGATAPRSGRGVLRDVELGIRRAQQTLEGINRRDVIVFAGDTLFFKDFDLGRILDFRASKGGSLLLYYQRREVDNPSQRGMCEVDGKTTKVVSFAEKPEPRQRGHDFSFVSPLFYILEPHRRSAALLPAALAICSVLAALCQMSSLAFVPAAQLARSPSVALRAEGGGLKEKEEVNYDLPSPDTSILGKRSTVGQTIDQDKRGNMWAVISPTRRQQEQGQWDTPIFFALLFVGTWALIAFFAVWTGNDPRFGGGIGDGAGDFGI
ncbi:unnamed protein product [Prorocentrum cordatum]|uniref:Nucleotidyl transferase domain-containing protein n=1 Tax=Prorocentrum cordatum TaxID=2364126 RepID=A0ABN9WIT7_9DINO|nr:unnamed protein product [Polarella glacialis]